MTSMTDPDYLTCDYCRAPWTRILTLSGPWPATEDAKRRVCVDHVERVL